MKKRIMGVLLTMVTVFALLPAAAWAAEEIAGTDEPMAIASSIPYIDADDSSKTQDSTTDVTAGDTEWTTGWYVVSGSVNISNRITASGEVHLILEDGDTLKANKGIEVSGENSLTIYRQTGQTGELSATGDYDNAGIGGGSGSTGGTIIINGGSVTATGSSGAGIGGGGEMVHRDKRQERDRGTRLRFQGGRSCL